MKRLPLTKTEEKIWSFVLGYISDYGHAPTRQEIANKFGYNNRQSADYFLKNMESKGYFKLGKGWRNIKIKEMAVVDITNKEVEKANTDEVSECCGANILKGFCSDCKEQV